MDVVILAARAGVGVAMLALSWYETSSKLTLRAQTGWLVLGIAGAAIAVAAHAGWVLRQRRAALARIALISERFSRVSPLSGGTVGAGGQLVCVTGSDTRLFHRAECSLVGGRAVTPASAEEHRATRRVPCEVCEP